MCKQRPNVPVARCSTSRESLRGKCERSEQVRKSLIRSFAYDYLVR